MSGNPFPLVGYPFIAPDIATARAILGVTTPPNNCARVYNSVDTSALTNNTLTTLTFDSERYDTNNLHSSSNPSRLTAPAAGKYHIGASVQFAFNASGQRQLNLVVNGTTTIAIEARQVPSAGGFAMTINTEYQLAANDYVELQALQTSGGSLAIKAFASYSPEFWMSQFS